MRAAGRRWEEHGDPVLFCLFVTIRVKQLGVG